MYPNKNKQVQSAERHSQMVATMAHEDSMNAALARRQDEEKDSGDAVAGGSQIVIVDKIKLVSKIEITLQKVHGRQSELEPYIQNALNKADRVISNEGAAAANAEEAKKEIITRAEVAKTYLLTELVGKLSDLVKCVNESKTKAQLDEHKETLIELTKAINKGKTEMLVTYVRKFNQTISSIGREASATVKGKKALVQKVESPQFVILMTAVKSDQINLTDSIFEAKGGLRACVMNVNTGESYDKVCSQPLLKKAMSKVDAATKKGVSACVQKFSGGGVIVKRFDELIAQALTPEVRTKAALPKADWATDIFSIEAFGSDSADSNVSWPAYGMMQCVFMVSGDAAFMGLRSEKVPGTTFQDKRANALRFTIDDVNRMVADGGWFCRFKDGVTTSGQNCLIIPSGFMVLRAGRNVRCLQWSLVADQADHNRVRNTMQLLLDSFAELKAADSPYVPLGQHWNLRV